MWAASPYHTLTEVLRGTRPIHFIDNTSAIAGLVKGYARPSDSAKIVHGCAATCAAISCSPFFGYVRSAANVGDLPSRLAIALLIRVLSQAGIYQDVHWVDAVMPEMGTWRQAAAVWLTTVGVDARVGDDMATARARWQHLVCRVPMLSAVRAAGMPSGVVYVGRVPAFGPTRFGNWAAKVARGDRGNKGAAEAAVRT